VSVIFKLETKLGGGLSRSVCLETGGGNVQWRKCPVGEISVRMSGGGVK
jgi:hypothetical protein